MKQIVILKALFRVLFLIFMALMIFMMGSDSRSCTDFRLLFGGALFLVSLLALGVSGLKKFFLHPVMSCFTLLVLFEILRSLWALVHPGDAAMDSRYAAAPLRWAYYLGCLYLGYVYPRNRRDVSRLGAVMAGCAFFIALNAIPRLSMTEGSLRAIGFEAGAFFHSVFYFHPAVAQYILGTFAHSNYVGDVMAFGLFPFLGLALYMVWNFFSQGRENRTASVIFQFFIPLVIAAVIFLFFSRGSILCFILIFLIYLIGICLKFPSRKQVVLAGVLFLAGLGFVSFIGNLTEAWKEVLTVEQEIKADSQKTTSLSTNREGARRAVAMFQDYPLWGVGMHGYRALSKDYRKPSQIFQEFNFADGQSMNHYLHLLAEEGAGAFIYYLFLAAFFI
ncbi:O-antigen ligase family protein, partial [Omnitrophica bacterium]|nr:O-antigen ligase family protein [Candidatus Omnitrophota bacterium]